MLNLHDRFKNEFWGAGFLGGIQPTWYMCSTFALYANFDVALLWGRFKAKKSECYSNIPDDVTVNISNSSKNEFYQMTPILDIGIGIRWEDTWCSDRYRTALNIGWEHHTYFDQNHRIKLETTPIGENDPVRRGVANFNEATGNLSMGGLVVRLSFDF